MENNKVKIKEEANGVEVEAKSKMGTLSVSDCMMTESSGVVSQLMRV